MLKLIKVCNDNLHLIDNTMETPLRKDRPDSKTKELVHIVIDKKPKKSESPTTGAELYILGNIKSGYDLFRKVHGHGDDDFIPNDNSEVILSEGEHFYSAQGSLNPGGCDEYH